MCDQRRRRTGASHGGVGADGDLELGGLVLDAAHDAEVGGAADAHIELAVGVEERVAVHVAAQRRAGRSGGSGAVLQVDAGGDRLAGRVVEQEHAEDAGRAALDREVDGGRAAVGDDHDGQEERAGVHRAGVEERRAGAVGLDVAAKPLAVRFGREAGAGVGLVFDEHPEHQVLLVAHNDGFVRTRGVRAGVADLDADQSRRCDRAVHGVNDAGEVLVVRDRAAGPRGASGDVRLLEIEIEPEGGAQLGEGRVPTRLDREQALDHLVRHGNGIAQGGGEGAGAVGVLVVVGHGGIVQQAGVGETIGGRRAMRIEDGRWTIEDGGGAVRSSALRRAARV